MSTTPPTHQLTLEEAASEEALEPGMTGAAAASALMFAKEARYELGHARDLLTRAQTRVNEALDLFDALLAEPKD